MKKTICKILYDIAMTVIMLLLMVYSLTGGFVHEILGLGVIVLFVLHKVFNYKWIFAVTKKFWNSKCDPFTRAKYIMDILLLVLFVATGFSGVRISTELFTAFGAKNRAVWVYLHNVSAYGLFLVISVHIGLHWSFIMAVFHKMLKLNTSKLRTIVLRICAGALVVMGIKAHTDKEFLKHFVPENLSDHTENESLSEAYDTINTADLFPEEQPQSIQKKGDHHGHHDGLSEDTTVTSPTDPDGEVPTLEEYLGKLHCTGCGKHCLLTRPQCMKGQKQAQQAQSEYMALYGDAQKDTETENPEIKFDEEDNDLATLFTTMFPVMSLYICGTYYTVEFVRKK